MHPRRIVALAAALLALGAQPARADGFLTPSIGFNYGGDSTNCVSLTSCDDKRTSWGVSIGSVSKIVGFEADFAYAPNFFGTASGGDNAVLTFMSNLLLVIPAGPIQPYGLIGLGLVRPHAQLNPSSLASDQNTLGYDIGGGVNVFLAPAVGVRGDVRHVRTLQDVTLGGLFANAPLDFWRASAGVTFRF
jgi:outer membrane protein with beta-barrel domain